MRDTVGIEQIVRLLNDDNNKMNKVQHNEIL